MLGNIYQIMFVELKAQRIKVSKLIDTIQKLNKYNAFVLNLLLLDLLTTTKMQKLLLNKLTKPLYRPILRIHQQLHNSRNLRGPSLSIRHNSNINSLHQMINHALCLINQHTNLLVPSTATTYVTEPFGWFVMVVG